MDMFIMAVRLLGVMAEMKEKTHKIFGWKIDIDKDFFHKIWIPDFTIFPV